MHISDRNVSADSGQRTGISIISDIRRIMSIKINISCGNLKKRKINNFSKEKVKNLEN